MFLRKIFNIEKPTFMSWDESTAWEALTRKTHPIGYFLTETIPDWLNSIDNYILRPITNVSYNIRCRYINHYYRVDTSLNKFSYHDKVELLLYANFQILVDYVEIELAHMYKICYLELPWFERFFSKWFSFRNPTYGVKYCTGEPGDLNEYLNDVYKLYDWWVNIRPNRKDPFYEYDKLLDNYTASEQDKFHFSEKWRKENPSEYNKFINTLSVAREIEQLYEKEDQDNLHKLIDLRMNLWT